MHVIVIPQDERVAIVGPGVGDLSGVALRQALDLARPIRVLQVEVGWSVAGGREYDLLAIRCPDRTALKAAWNVSWVKLLRAMS